MGSDAGDTVRESRSSAMPDEGSRVGRGRSKKVRRGIRRCKRRGLFVALRFRDLIYRWKEEVISRKMNVKG